MRGGQSHKGGDVVRRVSCFVVIILAFGAFGHGSENLDRDIAFDQSRNVHLPTIAAFGDVTLPKQTVCMPIADQQGVVKGLGCF